MAHFPVRCYCTAVIGHRWEPFVALLKEGKTEDAALDSMGIKSPCCRRMFICHNDTCERLIRYQAMETDNMKASIQSTAGGEEGEESGGEDA